MDEEIKEILQDETLDEAKKVEKLKELQDKASKDYVGNNYIPRDKFNEQKTTYETSYNELKKEYEAFKQSKMTDEEKAQAAKKAQEDALAEANKEIAKLTAESIFKGNGLKEADYQSFMTVISNMNKEDAGNFAESLAKLVTSQKEVATKAIEDGLVKNTPTPQMGTETVSNEIDIAKNNLAKARESGDRVEIAKRLSEYQEALNKK